MRAGPSTIEHYWQRDYRGFAEFFFGEAFSEPHSTKQIEDAVGWALDTTADTLTDTVLARFVPHQEGEALYRTHPAPGPGPAWRPGPHHSPCKGPGGGGGNRRTAGHAGRLRPYSDGAPSRDHEPADPRFRRSHDRLRGARRPWSSATDCGRNRRALYLSSPIGLGHARRDLAIAGELRDLHPDLEIDWLAQHPVTALLESAGEAIHPASRLLVNESGHIESEAGEHDLHVFQALRRMDEILVANFMLFQEIVEDGAYDSGHRRRMLGSRPLLA